MLKRVLSILSVVLVNGILWASPQEISGKVLSVIDGNTLEFQTSDNETFKLVLAGIDAPELNQEFGEEARKLLDKVVTGEAATVVIEGKDRLGNRIGSLLYRNDKDPRVELLKRGLAWTSEKNTNPKFESLRAEAKSQEKGLWGKPNPTPPWIFRRQQTMMTAKSS